MSVHNLRHHSDKFSEAVGRESNETESFLYASLNSDFHDEMLTRQLQNHTHNINNIQKCKSWLHPSLSQPFTAQEWQLLALCQSNVVMVVCLSSVSVPEAEWVEETGSHLCSHLRSHLRIHYETRVLDLWLLG